MSVPYKGPLPAFQSSIETTFFWPLGLLVIHEYFRDAFKLYDFEYLQYFWVIYSPTFRVR